MDSQSEALIVAFSTILVPEDGFVDDYYLPVSREVALAAIPEAASSPSLDA
jgi:hypothetical protein